MLCYSDLSVSVILWSSLLVLDLLLLDLFFKQPLCGRCPEAHISTPIWVRVLATEARQQCRESTIS